MELFQNNGAEFSQCRKYRFALWRIWDEAKPLVMFIGLNPSNANEGKDDPTIESVTRISKNNGYGGFYMMNCFPIVSSDPRVLKGFWQSPVSYIQNQDTLNRRKLEEVSKSCAAVVFAWGNFKIVRELNRDKELFQMFPNAKAIGTNNNGSPKHPLFQKGTTLLIDYTP